MSEPDSEHHEDDDVQNDAVIASAFRASLIVIMLLGLPVIGFLIYLNIEKAKERRPRSRSRCPKHGNRTTRRCPRCR